MIPDIQDLRQTAYLESIDFHLASSICDMASIDDEHVKLAIAALSRFSHMGNICVDLEKLGGTELVDEQGNALGFFWPTPKEWIDTLLTSNIAGNTKPNKPLMLEGSKLYLTRYWLYQKKLSEQILKRSKLEATDINQHLLLDGIERLLWDLNDEQKLAAMMAVLRNFTVISGGPGTGKTSIVVKFLALLIEQAFDKKRDIEILLLAPTGKASARLSESIASAIAESGNRKLKCAKPVLDAMQLQASTIHRSLWLDSNNPTKFRRNSDNPLSADVVIVDEASMVDLALMCKLVQAIPLKSRLILLGDKDQLASVESGAILSDIYEAGKVRGFSKAFTKNVKTLGAKTLLQTSHDESAGIWDCTIHLSQSYRFNQKSGIGKLAESIKLGKSSEALQILADSGFGDVELIAPENSWQLLDALEPIVKKYIAPYLLEKDSKSKLQVFNRFGLLAAHRKGLGGVTHINRLVEKLLHELGLIDCNQEWYNNRPVMIRRNDYQVGLFNGDIGLITYDKDNKPVAFFDEQKSMSPARMPAHETVYAMTIHKSQGSEFDQVMIVLPQNMSPVMTRELLYTAVTRAKEKVIILGRQEIIAEAIKTGSSRDSGLKELLLG